MDSISRKYPRTFYLPYSPGATKEDKIAKDLSSLIGQRLLMTEKMDGSNVCLTRDALYARSHNGPPTHASFDLLKAHHANVRHLIPEGIEIFGEWLYAIHSIRYNNLPSYLQIFGVRWNDAIWWSWEETREMANEILACTVPAIFEFCPATEDELRSKVEIVAIHNFFKPTYGVREGVVVRPLLDFKDSEFDKSVFKWVRKDHVQTDDHWQHKTIETNGLVSV
jgi:hypothetical protein